MPDADLLEAAVRNRFRHPTHVVWKISLLPGVVQVFVLLTDPYGLLHVRALLRGTETEDAQLVDALGVVESTDADHEVRQG